LARQKTLRDQGVATQASLDQAERTVLVARAKVTEIENQLALNASESKVLVAQRAIAERNLDFTTITAPYDLRIGEVSAELGQVVTRGSTLLVAEGTEAAEITAQFQMGQMRPLVRMLGNGGSARDMNARVILPLPGNDVTWNAKVDRSTEAIDARTQAVNIVVRVDNPQAQARAGVRPPLRRNMFVKVELSAPERKALVVPADAVHDYQVLVVTADNKLEPRTVSVAYRVENVAVISDGLAAGDRLVVTDPSVAVPGMTVTPIEDTALKSQIARAAEGEDAAK
jgi:RND family efflux transporter MFP subunit